MKEINRQRSLLVLVFVTLVFSIASPVFGTSITLSPNNGPVQTTVTTSGTGFTNGGTFINTNNNQASNTNLTSSLLYANKFTGLTVGATINSLALKIVNNGSGIITETNDFNTTTTGTGTFVYTEKFTGLVPNGTINKMSLAIQNTGIGTFTLTNNYNNSNTNLSTVVYAEKFIGLPPGADITTMSLDVFSVPSSAGPTPAVRVKIYQDDGAGGQPSTLLGESGSNTLTTSNTGIQPFSVSAKVPASGNVWAAFEVSRGDIQLFWQPNIGITTYFISHTYGSGPSPYGSGTAVQDTFWEKLTYVIHSSQVNIKIYQDDGAGGQPSTLLGQLGPFSINSTGINDFHASGTIPNSGNVWAAFEVNDSATIFYWHPSIGITTYFISHSFGSGPSPYGSGTSSQDTFWERLQYTVSPTLVRIKMYQDDGAGGGPSTLLAQSGAIQVNNTGTITFTCTNNCGLVPASGNVWAAFESNHNSLTLDFTSSAGGYHVSHSFGSGPSPFGTLTSDNSLFWEKLTSSKPISLTFTWDGSPILTNPSNPSTNNTGGFNQTTFFVPIDLVGGHTLKVTDSQNVQDTKTFTVTVPIVTTTLTKNLQFLISSIYPLSSYSGLPVSLTVTKQDLYRNGTLIQTFNNPGISINSGVPTTLQTMGEIMPYSSIYQVNVTLTDGANTFISTSNTTTIQMPINPISPGNGKTCSIDFCPSQTLVNYTVHRTPDYKTLLMTVNLLPIPFHTECDIVNGTFGNAHKWFNYSSVNSVSFSTHVPPTDNAYYACYGSGPILSGVSPGNGTLIVQGANVFNQTFGVTLGVPIGTFFIALLASLANQRTGPIYVVVVLCSIGIMAALLFFTVPNGAWALELITGFLGIFVGRKIF